MHETEFNTERTITKDLIETRYILGSLGVNADKATKLHGDNKATCILIALNDRFYKKKYTAIAFCKLREAVVAGSIRPYYITSKENRSDF